MTVEYDSSVVRPPAVREISELWRYRDLLRLLVANSIKTRYKRSTLGVLWTLLNPLLNTLVLTIALSQLFRFQVQNYPLYLLTGLVVWNFFSQTTQGATSTLVWGSSLLKRIYVPRTIFALSVLGNGLVNLLLSLIPLAVVMLITRHPFSIHVLWLPVPILLVAMFTLGIALFVSALAVFFVDVVDLYSVLISVWFYLTPIIYPMDIVPASFAVYLRWNPMNLLVEQFRFLIYEGRIPDLSIVALTALVALGTLCLGWWVFTKRIDELAYRL